MSVISTLNQVTNLISQSDLTEMKKNYKNFTAEELISKRNQFKAMLLRIRIMRKTENEALTNLNLASNLRKMIARFETLLKIKQTN